MIPLGILATAGQLFMTIAFRQAHAAILAPYNYTSIVWAALIGLLVWNERIGSISMLGIALIAGSAMAAAFRRGESVLPIVEP